MLQGDKKGDQNYKFRQILTKNRVEAHFPPFCSNIGVETNTHFSEV